MRTADYSSFLRRKRKGRKAAKVVRTEKRPGDLEIVYRDGEYQLHRYEAGGKEAA